MKEQGLRFKHQLCIGRTKEIVPDLLNKINWCLDQIEEPEEAIVPKNVLVRALEWVKNEQVRAKINQERH